MRNSLDLKEGLAFVCVFQPWDRPWTGFTFQGVQKSPAHSQSVIILLCTNLMLVCLDSLTGLGYTGLPNGFHSFPGESLSCSAARHPSVSSLRHSSVGEDSTHPLLGPEEQVKPPQICWVHFWVSPKAQGILTPCHSFYSLSFSSWRFCSLILH